MRDPRGGKGGLTAGGLSVVGLHGFLIHRWAGLGMGVGVGHVWG